MKYFKAKGRLFSVAPNGITHMGRLLSLKQCYFLNDMLGSSICPANIFCSNMDTISNDFAVDVTVVWTADGIVFHFFVFLKKYFIKIHIHRRSFKFKPIWKLMFMECPWKTDLKKSKFIEVSKNIKKVFVAFEIYIKRPS